VPETPVRVCACPTPLSTGNPPTYPRLRERQALEHQAPRADGNPEESGVRLAIGEIDAEYRRQRPVRRIPAAGKVLRRPVRSRLPDVRAASGAAPNTLQPKAVRRLASAVSFFPRAV